MNTKPSLGTGFAGVWAHAVAAGIIDSSRGRASVADALFRSVRLGIAFLVRNITLSSYGLLTGDSCFRRLRAAHLKRNALDDSENERRQPVSVLLRLAHDAANRRRVVVLDAASERERQKVLRQRRGEQFGTAQQGVFQSGDPSVLRGAGQCAQRVDGLPVYFSLPPLSYRIEVLEREAHRVNRAVAAGAHGVATMRRQALAHRQI